MTKSTNKKSRKEKSYLCVCAHGLTYEMYNLMRTLNKPSTRSRARFNKNVNCSFALSLRVIFIILECERRYITLHSVGTLFLFSVAFKCGVYYISTAFHSCSLNSDRQFKRKLMLKHKYGRRCVCACVVLIVETPHHHHR